MSNSKYLSVTYKNKKTAKNVEELISSKENYWKDWYCSAGLRNLYIDYDGNVFVCNNSSSKLNRFDQKKWEQRISELKEKGIDVLSSESYKNGVYQKYLRAFERSGQAFNNELDYYDPENFKRHWGFLGSIYQNFNINQNIVICPFKQCGCGSDIPLAKAKAKEDLISYLAKGQLPKININSEENEQIFVSNRMKMPATILWDLGRRCNYDCSYCWPAVHNAKEAHKEIKLLLKTCHKIIQELCPGEQKMFCFSGGEPTLHPNIVELLTYIKENNHLCLITTNGSTKTELWQEVITKVSHIQMSAHFEFLKEDIFLQNVKSAIDEVTKTKHLIHLDIKLMTPPNKIERSLKLKQMIKNYINEKLLRKDYSHYLKISLVPLRGIDNSEELLDYTQEELKYFS